MRERIGSFITRGNCEAFLNRWIKNYVLLDGNAGIETMAKYPLREASIDVSEVPGKPDSNYINLYFNSH